MAGDATVAVELVFRQEGGRVLAGLMRRFGDLGLAEDVLQEACRKALELWPQTGVPEHPAAWLASVARHAALDQVRRAGKSVADADAVLSRLPAAMLAETQAIEDDRLRLLFICCHLRQRGRVPAARRPVRRSAAPGAPARQLAAGPAGSAGLAGPDAVAGVARRGQAVVRRRSADTGRAGSPPVAWRLDY